MMWRHGNQQSVSHGLLAGLGLVRRPGLPKIPGNAWVAIERRRFAVSQTIQPMHLPSSLRALRVGMDDDLHVRRTVHLAAAKIEDLESQVTRLTTALEQAARPDVSRRGRGRRRRDAH